MLGTHPYLNFTFSDTYPGKLVVSKTVDAQPYPDGLAKKGVKVVEIPSSFNGIEIAEIGFLSFYQLGIASIFIRKTIPKLHKFNRCSIRIRKWIANT